MLDISKFASKQYLILAPKYYLVFITCHKKYFNLLLKVLIRYLQISSSADLFWDNILEIPS